MARVSEMIESKYLKQSDVDEDVTVTIQKVGRGNIAKEGDEPEHKWMVKFEEFKKPMILNSTNIKRLARACESEDTDEWVGRKVVLYVDPDVEFAGNVVGGLRIRAAVKPTKKKPAANPGSAGVDGIEEDIPF
jgi:hypothetical protein